MDSTAIHPDVQRVLAFHQALDKDSPLALTLLCTVHVESSQDGETTTGVDGLLPWMRDTARSGTAVAIHQTSAADSWVLEARTAAGATEYTTVTLRAGLVSRVSRHRDLGEAAAAVGATVAGVAWSATG